MFGFVIIFGDSMKEVRILRVNGSCVKIENNIIAPRMIDLNLDKLRPETLPCKVKMAIS